MFRNFDMWRRKWKRSLTEVDTSWSEDKLSFGPHPIIGRTCNRPPISTVDKVVFSYYQTLQWLALPHINYAMCSLIKRLLFCNMLHMIHRSFNLNPCLTLLKTNLLMKYHWLWLRKWFERANYYVRTQLMTTTNQYFCQL